MSVRVGHSFLDLRPLYFFIEVAEAGSLSRAALSLSVGQPALSREIRRLEELYRVTVFYRNGRGITLTDAGQELLVHAKEIMRGLVTARDSMAAAAKSLSGQLRIAIPPMFSDVLTIDILRSYRAEHADLSFAIREGLSVDVVEWLGNGEVDVAVVYSPPMVSTLVSEHLANDRLVLVGRPGTLDLLSGEEIPFRGIADLALVLPPQPHKIRQALESAASGCGRALRIEVEVTGMASVLEMVHGGVGFTILPYGLIHREIVSGTLNAWPIVEPVIRPKVYLTHSMQRPLTPAIRSIIGAIRHAFRSGPDSPQSHRFDLTRIET